MTLEIPEVLSEAVASETWALDTLVSAAYAEGKIGISGVQQALDLGYFDALRWLKEREVPEPSWSDEEMTDYLAASDRSVPARASSR